jgi:hypothetical protein
MAKISASIPDALKDALDAYAKAHDVGVSVVVQKALAAFLEHQGEGHPSPSVPPQPNLLARVAILEQYLLAYYQHIELVRDAVES